MTLVEIIDKKHKKVVKSTVNMRLSSGINLLAFPKKTKPSKPIKVNATNSNLGLISNFLYIRIIGQINKIKIAHVPKNPVSPITINENKNKSGVKKIEQLNIKHVVKIAEE